MITGLITAIVTPFDVNYNIDFISLEKLLELQINSKVDGIVVLGSTGEAINLTPQEQMTLLQFIINKVTGRLKIIVGVNQANTNFACNFITELNNIQGIDYIMVTTPSYIRPTQAGLYEHFIQISSISTYPIIIYNVPQRTGCDISNDIILRLSYLCDNIVAVKDTTAKLNRISYLVKHRPNNFSILSGDDETAMATILCGGNGVISVISNVLPTEMYNLISHARNANNNAAINVNNQLLDIIQAMNCESNPIAIKWALYYKKIINLPNLRLPLTTLSDDNQKKLASVLDKIC